MILLFCLKVQKGEFYIHNSQHVEDFAPQCEDLQVVRGMLYYLMEELPYIPTEI